MQYCLIECFFYRSPCLIDRCFAYKSNKHYISSCTEPKNNLIPSFIQYFICPSHLIGRVEFMLLDPIHIDDEVHLSEVTQPVVNPVMFDLKLDGQEEVLSQGQDEFYPHDNI